MKPTILIIAAILFCSLAVPAMALASLDASQSGQDKVTDVYVFSQQGCPYCAKTLSLLEELKSKDYPELKIHSYDMKEHPEYFTKFEEFAKAYGTDINKVPTTFINKTAIAGFRESDLRQMVEYCHLPVNSCVDPAKFVQEKLSQPTPVQEEKPFTNTARPEVIGWILIGGIVIGGAIFIFNKMI